MTDDKEDFRITRHDLMVDFVHRRLRYLNRTYAILYWPLLRFTNRAGTFITSIPTLCGIVNMPFHAVRDALLSMADSGIIDNLRIVGDGSKRDSVEGRLTTVQPPEELFEWKRRKLHSEPAYPDREQSLARLQVDQQHVAREVFGRMMNADGGDD